MWVTRQAVRFTWAETRREVPEERQVGGEGVAGR